MHKGWALGSNFKVDGRKSLNIFRNKLRRRSAGRISLNLCFGLALIRMTMDEKGLAFFKGLLL
jgi:hypothetical protein